MNWPITSKNDNIDANWLTLEIQEVEDQQRRRNRYKKPMSNKLVFTIVFFLSVFIYSQLTAYPPKTKCDIPVEECERTTCQVMPLYNSNRCAPARAGWACHACGYFNLVDSPKVRYCGVCGAKR
jgi:hypothetical protein